MAKAKYNCTDDGFCVIDTGKKKSADKKSISGKRKGRIIYFGDPMCSWCWGISDDIKKLKEHYDDQFNFELVMGGLRPGGGDAWDDRMKQFLKHHWSQVSEVSGQSFNFDLLDSDMFDYDTEPACRAVRIVRDMAPQLELEFYGEIQHKFYVENEDPKSSDFYRSICHKLKIPFKAFRPMFLSSVYCDIVKEDFKKALKYGVQGFPTLMLETRGEPVTISNGFATFSDMSNRIDKATNHPGKLKKLRSKIKAFNLLNF